MEHVQQQSRFDNIIRLMSYRAVDGFPLVAVVGMSRDDIFSQSNETLQHYLVIGSTLTAIVLVVMMLGGAERKRVLSATAELQCSKQSLEQSNRLLHAASGTCRTASRCSTTTAGWSCATTAMPKCTACGRNRQSPVRRCNQFSKLVSPPAWRR